MRTGYEPTSPRPSTVRSVISCPMAQIVPRAGVLALLLGLSSAASAQDVQDPYVVLDEASARFATIQSLCADFRQVLDVRLLQERREGTGRLCQERPGLFSMRFDDPAGDMVVVDGESAWMYTPSRDPNQVIRTKVSAATKRLDLHSEFLESPRERYVAEYEGADTVAGVQTTRILLRPRERTSYREAVVWIGPDNLLRQVEIREENGSVRTVTLLTNEPGVDVPPATFRFSPPPGARVMER